MSGAHCIIVGGGHAAAQVVASLCISQWPGRITLVSAESYLPYQRPPLSKSYLSGSSTIEQILIRNPDFYKKPNLDVRLATRVTEITRSDKSVRLDDQSTLRYDKLVLATGAQVRRTTIDGHGLPGVFYLRSAADADGIRQQMPRTNKAVVIGGGYIGLETAAVLCKAGIGVTVLEALPRVLQRVTTEEISAFYKRVHEEEGVRVVTGVVVKSIDGDEYVRSVTLQSGEVIDAQLVIVGIGVVACTDLAAVAGLTVSDGIVVDEYGRTSDPDILAAGDCTNHFNALYGRNIRLESVQNATDQAKVVADTLGGRLSPYRAIPWFWSDQFDMKLQIAGLSQGYDRVVLRGSTTEGRSFAAFYFQGDRLLAIDALNRPKEFVACRKALSEGRRVDPALLADELVPIQDAFAEAPQI
ncbi:FAD-dependent oxidoreductase [Rugamonas sp. FT82W]|uniref:FAD-dependent oxidoreductase n=1 Tax=Duganella vulcania TaxID=2692166 RepID=A0A845G874_9BURK|nr:FAD-dependent oxidoreductase [Duganella vulcania]MYM90893.1 FAD-dependent oxidoreductase [Duganella vulcania]